MIIGSNGNLNFTFLVYFLKFLLIYLLEILHKHTFFQPQNRYLWLYVINFMIQAIVHLSEKEINIRVKVSNHV